MTRRVHRVHGYRPAPRKEPSTKPPVIASVALSLLGLALLHGIGHPAVLPTARAVAAQVPHRAHVVQQPVQVRLPAARPSHPLHRPQRGRRAVVAPQGTIAHRLTVPLLQENPEGWIDHVPSVSLDAVQQALGEVGSPLAGMSCLGMPCSHYIWRAGRTLGIDPAAFLAIFQHESSFGKYGMAALTHDRGNLRCYNSSLPGAYCDTTNGGYEFYPNWQEGIDATYSLLWSYAHHGAQTISQAIPVWAPPSENATGAYIRSVLGTMARLYTLSRYH